MITIYNNIIPFKGYKAINIFGILYVRKGCTLSVEDYIHEYIHTLQQRELLYVGFYIAYLLEWLFHLVRYRFDNNKAYHAISFEKEAYDNESNMYYPIERKHYAQWKDS